MSLPPPAALATYEQLRAEVLSGQVGPDGLTPIVYHGMLHGLELILARPVAETPSPVEPAAVTEGASLDAALLRLIVNMLLQAQSRETHVY
jgi:hypothetical protein